jgi:hypothetical protein
MAGTYCRVAHGEGIPEGAGTKARTFTGEHASGGSVARAVEDGVFPFRYESAGAVAVADFTEAAVVFGVAIDQMGGTGTLKSQHPASLAIPVAGRIAAVPIDAHV